MLKTMRLISVAAVAALALPALAGSWPPIAPRKAPKAAAVSVTTPAPRAIDGFEAVAGEAGWQLVQPSYNIAGGKLVRTDTPVQTLTATNDALPATGFEPAGGDAGWALSQHKYVFAGGRLAMSDDCDHAIRTAKAPTAAEIETARKFSPGA